MFKYSIFLLSFYLLILSVIERRFLNSLIIPKNLYISLYSYISFCFIYFYFLLLDGIYILFMNWSLHHYEISFFIPGYFVCIKSTLFGGFSDSPVAKTPHSQCSGPEFQKGKVAFIRKPATQSEGGFILQNQLQIQLGHENF